MTSERDSQILILTGIAVLLGVLFDFAWILAHRKLRVRRGDNETSPAEKNPLQSDFLPWVDRSDRNVNQDNGGWNSLWRVVFPWIRPVLLSSILILAAVPSALVVMDRWFDLEKIRYLFSDLRCKVPLLCTLPLPEYILLILFCLLAVGLLIALFPLGRHTFLELRADSTGSDAGISTMQITISRLLRWISLVGFAAIAVFSVADRRIPGAELALIAGTYVAGWFLRDISLVRAWKILWDNRSWLFACLLAHLALVMVLAVYFSSPNYLPIFAAVLVLAILFLFRFRHRIPTIYWIFSMGIILFSININAWWTSVVGDEYGFYESAREILGKTNLSVVAARLFDEMGVYGQNSYFSSVVQSVFMRVFGTQSFGWRFSNIYLIALSILLFYIFFKTFLDRRVALLACFFLAASHYLINFSKIGYVSLQALFSLSISLAVAAWAVRSGRTAAFALCGVVLAMNFYVFGIAIVSIPLVLLLLLCFAPPISRPARLRWAVLAGGFGILCFPLCFQPAFWKTGFGFTIFTSLGKNPFPDGPVQFLANRILTSWFSYLYVTNESHFVSISYVDWMTAAFVGIGFFAILYWIRRSRFAVFFLLGWILLLTVASIIGSPDLPSSTRMFVVLPWWAVAAAFGLCWLWDQIRFMGSAGGRIPTFIFAGVLAILVATNFFYATVISYDRWLDRLPFESLVLRRAGESRGASLAAPEKFVFLTYADWSLDPFLRFKEIYPRSWSGIQLEKVAVESPLLPESTSPILTDSKSILFVVPTLPEQLQDGLRVSLQALGEKWCPVYSPSGKWEYDMYTSKEMAWMCSKPNG
jgi:hypothetical protein